MFKPANAWSVRLFEPAAVPVVHLCLALRLSPNAVTVLSFVIAMVAAVVFALVPGYRGLLAGGLIFQFGFLFDLADGAVARMTGHVTKFGAMLDGKLDKIKKFACLAAILYAHWWLATTSPAWLLLGIGLVVASYAIQIILSLVGYPNKREHDSLRRALHRWNVTDWADPLDFQFLMLVVAPICGMSALPWIWAGTCLLMASRLAVELIQPRAIAKSLDGQ